MHRVEHKDERPARQEDVAHDEILDVKETALAAHRVNAREEVESQGAGQRKHEDCRAVHESRLLAAPPRQIHRAGHDVFKDSEHRRKSRKRHEEEKETAPEDAARHVVENVRQCAFR